MLNEACYNACITRIYGLLKRNSIYENPENYTNEAYLKLAESGADITLDSLYKTARHLILNENTLFKYRKGDNKQTTKICGGCKNDLPLGCFGMSYDKLINKKRVNYLCRECDRLKQLAYPKERRKENLQNSIVNLTDGYIKKNLRNLGIKNQNITQTMIAECRERIINKRSMYDSQKLVSFGFPLENFP